MDYVALFILVGVLIPMYFARHQSQIERADYIKQVGFYMMIGFAILGGYWIAGQAMADPGDLQGVWIIFGCLTPIILLSVAAWRTPRIAIVALGTLSIAILAASISELAGWSWPMGWSALNGPITTIAVFAVSVPIAVYGNFHNARISASGLLLIGLVPWILSSAQRGWDSLFALTATSLFSSPAVVTGVLFLWSARMVRQPERTPLAITA